jgi:hypothetical protein
LARPGQARLHKVSITGIKTVERGKEDGKMRKGASLNVCSMVKK